MIVGKKYRGPVYERCIMCNRRLKGKRRDTKTCSPRCRTALFRTNQALKASGAQWC